MNVLYFFIGAAVVGAIGAGLVFLWAMKSGQFDDLEGPAYRILYDDDDPMIPANRRRSQGEAGAGEAQADEVDSGKAGT
ncbi:MAG: cbb3-type cytochrome oxidase assembly protein CcoS [Pseudomonadota bacterium]|uniref:cbb3-type cytochrome oxidase assembly protein CcoS n=1 Tax=Thermithiobacillus tepidarius TaxID=929 RepID=UPI0003F69535|nr:cbb3-type cytochrome oxidase assembly protein CcoS [Thermithiobacillus tepidarius]